MVQDRDIVAMEH